MQPEVTAIVRVGPVPIIRFNRLAADTDYTAYIYHRGNKKNNRAEENKINNQHRGAFAVAD